MTRSRLASWIYISIAMPSLVLGSIYLFRPTFMPYHAVAVGKEWAEQTPASPPWPANLGVCIAALVALLLDAPWRRLSRTSPSRA